MMDENTQLLTPEYNSPAWSLHSSPSRSSCEGGERTTDCDADVESNISIDVPSYDKLKNHTNDEKVAKSDFLSIMGILALLGGLMLIFALIFIVFVVFQREVSLHRRKEFLNNSLLKRTFLFSNMTSCGKMIIVQGHLLVALRSRNGVVCRFHDIDISTRTVAHRNETFPRGMLSSLCVSHLQCFAIYRNGFIRHVEKKKRGSKYGIRFCKKILDVLLISDINSDGIPDILEICVRQNNTAYFVVLSGVDLRGVINIEIPVNFKVQNFIHRNKERIVTSTSLDRSVDNIYVKTRSVESNYIHVLNLEVVAERCLASNCAWAGVVKSIGKSRYEMNVMFMDVNDDKIEDVICINEEGLGFIIDGRTGNKNEVRIPPGNIRTIPVKSTDNLSYVGLLYKQKQNNCRLMLLLDPRQLKISFSVNLLIPFDVFAVTRRSLTYFTYLNRRPDASCDLSTRQPINETTLRAIPDKYSYSKLETSKSTGRQTGETDGTVSKKRHAVEMKFFKALEVQKIEKKNFIHLKRQEYNPMYQNYIHIVEGGKRTYIPTTSAYVTTRSEINMPTSTKRDTKKCETFSPEDRHDKKSLNDVLQITHKRCVTNLSRVPAQVSHFIKKLRNRLNRISAVIFFSGDDEEKQQIAASPSHQRRRRFRRSKYSDSVNVCPNLKLVSLKLNLQQKTVISNTIFSHHLDGCRYTRQKITDSITAQDLIVTNVEQYSSTGECDSTIIRIDNI